VCVVCEAVFPSPDFPCLCYVGFAVTLALTKARAENPTTDKSAYTLFDPTPIELRRTYNTDRPSKTDSPYTIDAGVVQIEMDIANWTLDENNIDRTDVRVRTLLLAQTNFKVGLTNWMVFPQRDVERRTSGRDFRGSETIGGFGDTTTRLKINLIGNDGGKLAIGLISSLKIPTNTNHLGNNLYEPGFGLPFNYGLPGGFIFFGQARIDILDEPHSGNRRVQWSTPIGVSRAIVRNLRLPRILRCCQHRSQSSMDRNTRYGFDLSSHSELLCRCEFIFRTDAERG
jgi:Putative MetA-pathway of phenol degradation